MKNVQGHVIARETSVVSLAAEDNVEDVIIPAHALMMTARGAMTIDIIRAHDAIQVLAAMRTVEDATLTLVAPTLEKLHR